MKRQHTNDNQQRRMHVMMMLVSYPPVIDSGARLYSELSESLRKMGHSITVVTEHPAEGGLVDRSHDYFTSNNSRSVIPGEVVLRVSPLSFMAKIPGGKALRYLMSCLLFSMRGIFAKRPDVILVYSPPLFMGISGYIISLIRGTRFVFNLQDIHPKVLFDSGAIKHPLIKGMLLKIEEVCYRKAHSLIAYSDGNRRHILQRWANAQVFTIPNWVDIESDIRLDENRSFRNKEEVGNKFVVSYAGTMQQAQGLEIVVGAAKDLRKCDDIIFLLAGEGTSKPVLNRLIAENGIRNVLLHTVMPKEQYRQFISESDVCLITLSPDIPLETVPGKLADIMGHGKPVILAASPDGDAAEVIKIAECGYCVKPGDARALSEVVLGLRNDKVLRNKMGVNARLYAEQHFSRYACTRQYEKVLCSAMMGKSHYA